ncbi:hypothetical protein EsDP_00002274 [Epichloe bromicola]|uniref:Deoxyribonuclease NucA/NucB domain-containing protein n=1 Tax=Epichloe bromicola TaxID=79588 RepID=A0ABQ0CKC2_9HYPO
MHISGAAAIILLVSSAAARTVKYDCEKTPQICLNTCWAIKCKRNAETLHGGGQKNAMESSKYNSANRNRWGYSAKPCDNGWGWTTPDKKKASSPDEYPYASSKEGGQPNFPKVVALRCVPLNEQKIQGGKLRGLGTDKKSGTWTTKWVNINKLSQDWCGPKPSCKNDGHQFISGGPKGPFKPDPNPKKVRDIGSYSEDGTSAWVESRDVAEDEDLDEVEARDVDEEVDEPEGGMEAREADDETETTAEARDVEVPFES